MTRSNYLVAIGAISLCWVMALSGCPPASGFVAPQPVQRQPCTSVIPGPRRWNKEGDCFWKRNKILAENEGKQMEENKLPFYLDPGTKGGAVFLSLVAFVVPILFYQFVTNVFNVDGLEAGKWIGGGFAMLVSFAWVSSLIYRVATKDMTYAKQLKDYENAVIAKRLEELDEDELEALVEEVERDKF